MADTTLNAPASSSEIGRLFNLGPNSAESSIAAVPATSPSPANLPVYEDVPVEVIEPQASGPAAQSSDATPAAPAPVVVPVSDDSTPISPGPNDSTIVPQPTRTSRGSAIFHVIKKILPYVIVFAVGLGLYYFYFSSFSFSSLFKGGTASVITKPQTNVALATLEKQDAADYQKWIGQFFFDVTDQNITGMDTDVSGNGLTNFQKYLLNLNPKMYDTLGDGTGDGQKIINKVNPWTGLAMTDDQKKVADAYLDTELISNRIAGAQADHNNVAFAPYVSNNSPYYQAGISNINNGNPSNVNSSNGGEVAGAVIYNNNNQPATGNSPAAAGSNPGPSQAPQLRAPSSSTSSSGSSGQRTAPMTGVSHDPANSTLNIDTSVPGKIDLPTLKVSIPLIWTTDVKNFDSDLKKGVVHYPGTPLPGDTGSSYVSGHSSGYFWDHSQYKQAFAHLGDLKDGASFTVTVTLQGGKQAVLHYVVGGRAEYAANDPKQFQQSSDSTIALSTCWPVNTTAKRLVVFGTLTQVEK